MALSRAPFIAAFLRFAAGLRFRQLFFIAGGLFLLDMLVPDLIPFADEILLGLLTLLFGAWKKRAPDELLTESARESNGGDNHSDSRGESHSKDQG